MRISDWSSDVCSSDLENPVGGRCRVDVATCLPGLGISVPMKVRKREAELRYTGIDQGIQSQCPGNNEFAVNSRLDGRCQDIWNSWKSNHRFAESGLPRQCCIEHLVTAIGRSDERRVGKEMASTGT